jgi:DNA-binding CsgD family transcriptional regulator
MIQINQRTGNMYYKYLKVSTPDTGEMKINQLLVNKPSDELIKHYEIKKTDFTNKLNAEVQSKLTIDEEKPEEDLPELTEKQRTILELLEDGFTPKEMVNKLMISQRTIYDHMRLIRKKGYNIIRGKKYKPLEQEIKEKEVEGGTI